MHNRIDIDHRHSLAISREIAERLQALVGAWVTASTGSASWRANRRPSFQLRSAMPETRPAMTRGP